MQVIEKILSRLKPFRLKKNIYIITYHGIVEQRKDDFWERNFTLLTDFREHLAFFKQYKILTTDELRNYIQHNSNPLEPCFYITFDDGYKNNLLAAELFRKLQIPWTLFITTECITTGSYIWTIDLALLFKFSTARSVEFAGQNYALDSQENRITAFNHIRKFFKQLPSGERIKQMASLQNRLVVETIESLRAQAPEFEMLNWNEIRTINAYTEIGSHGVTHELLHSHQKDETIRFELSESKKQIEQELGKKCTLYAYPNGDYCDRACSEALNAGYDLAFTTKHIQSTAPYHRLLLSRTDAVTHIHKLKKRLGAY